jgi:hypothetical protein
MHIPPSSANRVSKAFDENGITRHEQISFTLVIKYQHNQQQLKCGDVMETGNYLRAILPRAKAWNRQMMSVNL